jgi:3-oxoadipate enol-lactonase
MPALHLPPDLDLHYELDDYTDPWTSPETVLLMHGNSESSVAWHGWVPHLARHYRVVRPDMRGFGRSTVMPRDYAWSLDRIIGDYLALMDALGVRRFHLVGAKIAGIIGQAFAARHPDRVRTLTLVGTPPPSRERSASMTKEFEEHGVSGWAGRTMAARLGSDFPPEGLDWWTAFMGRTSTSTQIGFMTTIPYSDVRAEQPSIRCPTLVITTEGSGLASVEHTRQWQQAIPGSSLLVLPGDSHHVAASAPDRCAAETLAFLARHGG